MYHRALVGYEKALGLEHLPSLDMVNTIDSLHEANGMHRKRQKTCINELSEVTKRI